MDITSTTRAAENRTRWKGIVANSYVVPRRPSKVMAIELNKKLQVMPLHKSIFPVYMSFRNLEKVTDWARQMTL